MRKKVIKKLAAALAVAAVFCTALPAAAAEKGTSRLRLIKADTANGVVESWDGTLSLADDAAENASTEFAQRLINFEDGSYWGYMNGGADWTRGNRVEYRYDADSSFMQLKMNSGEGGWANAYFHLGQSAPSDKVSKIILAVNSNRHVDNFRMSFRKDGNDNPGNGRYFGFELKQGFYEYTIDVSENELWAEQDAYDYFKFDYEPQDAGVVTELDVAYLRLVDDTYEGACNDSGDGIWIRNGTENYDINDTVVDMALPAGKTFAEGTVLTSDSVTINGKPAEWVICGSSNRIRVNLGRLVSNMKYVIRFNEVYYNDGTAADDIFTFTTAERISLSGIGLLKNGAFVKDMSSVSAGDELELKLYCLSNNSDEPAVFYVIQALYGNGGALVDVGVTKVMLAAQQVLTESTLDMTVPGEVTNAERLSLFIWNGDDAMPMTPEVKERYVIE